MDSIKDKMAKICRKISGGVGDSSFVELSPTQISVVDDLQNGGAKSLPNDEFDSKNEEIGVTEAPGETKAIPRECEGCSKTATPKNNGKPTHFMCNFCTKWFCLPCAEITRKPEIDVASRDDIFWACKPCVSCLKGTYGDDMEGFTIKAKPVSVGGEVDQQGDQSDVLLSLGVLKSTIEGRINTLEANIEQSFKNALGEGLNSVHDKVDKNTDSMQVKVKETVEVNMGKAEVKMDNSIKESIDVGLASLQASMTKSMELSIEHSMAKAWSSSIFGDDDFPELGSEEWKDVVSRKKSKALPQVIKQSVAETYEQISDDEKRLNSVILYRAPESGADNAERHEKDKKMVHDLLKEIEVRAEPTKIYRLGELDPEKADDKSRPLKVEFENHEIQDRVIKSAHKLKDAPDNLKKISVSYDMSREQRKQAKTLHEEAKGLTKNSKVSVWRVRGLPGKMQVKEFKKRSQ